MIMVSRLRSLLILWAALFGTLTSASSEGESHYVMGRKVEAVSSSTTSELPIVGTAMGDSTATISSELAPTIDVEGIEIDSSIPLESGSLPTTTQRSNPYQGTRGAETTASSASSSSSTQHRKTQDVEDMLQDMATRDPADWSAAEWLLMILFLSFFGWLGCCLLSLCCCGGRGSNIIGWLCCWEICCRGGTDIDRCCDYALA